MRAEGLRVWVLAAGALVVIGVIVGMFVLPDTLTTQVSGAGAVSGTMPKPLGLLIPLALAVAGNLWYRADGQPRGAVVAFVGVLATALLFVMNL